MTNEISFKIWDRTNRKFVEQPFALSKIGVRHIGEIVPFGTSKDPRYEIVLASPYQDRDGRFIYEKDILTGKNREREVVFIDMKTGDWMIDNGFNPADKLQNFAEDLIVKGSSLEFPLEVPLTD